MKHSFAEYYHELVFDDDIYLDYFNWVKREVRGETILECACGTGYLSHLLAKDGYKVDALDNDESMIGFAKLNHRNDRLNFHYQSMFDLSPFGMYDAIIIFLDSLNYCRDINELRLFFKQAYDHLNHNGILLFDIHHPNRLNEFVDEYVEEGFILDNSYQWSIQSDGNRIHHNIVVYEDDSLFINQVNQVVYDSVTIETLLNELSFDFERVYYFNEAEFDLDEKLYYRARKG